MQIEIGLAGLSSLAPVELLSALGEGFVFLLNLLAGLEGKELVDAGEVAAVLLHEEDEGLLFVLLPFLVVADLLVLVGVGLRGFLPGFALGGRFDLSDDSFQGVLSVRHTFKSSDNQYISGGIWMASSEPHEPILSMTVFHRLYRTFELGEIVSLLQEADENPAILEDGTLANHLVEFICQVSEDNKKESLHFEYLALLICESFIYNMYNYYSHASISNSLYSNSLLICSSSHISIDQSMSSLRIDDPSDDNIVRIGVFLKSFSSNERLLKKLKTMLERKIKAKGMSQSKDKEGEYLNQRYIEILLETMEYILGKENQSVNPDKKGYQVFQDSKNKIIKNSTALSSHYEKKNLKAIVEEVNKIIFSSKLNRISYLLTEADTKILCSLLRIYFAESSSEESGEEAGPRRRRDTRSKYFQKREYSGDDMLLNLWWIYIDSIRNKSELFEVSKNPLYLLLEAKFICFFMPTFRSFSRVVIKCCKLEFEDSLHFYAVSQSIINKDLINFIDLIPPQLLSFLQLLYRLVRISAANPGSSAGIRRENSNARDNSAITSVKKLFLYSFLVKPDLIQGFYSQSLKLSKYEEVCNLLINLFFKSSLKKYESASPHPDNSHHISLISGLTKAVSTKLDNKITSFHPDLAFDFQDEGMNWRAGVSLPSFVIEEPILNHDYEVLWERIKDLEFTPKDLKQFEMKKMSWVGEQEDTEKTAQELARVSRNYDNREEFSSPDKPAYSPFKKESLEIMTESFDLLEPAPEDATRLDFITWMTVGGSRDYSDPLAQVRATRRRQPKPEFETFDRAKVNEIERLFEEYHSILKE